MKAEIITIGDELLIGQTIDTNSAWIASELSKLGIDTYQIISISDKRDHILKTLSEVTGRSDIVLITGGLGPTSDDITKQVLCEYFETRLVENKEVLANIEDILKRRNFTMNENNRKQAEVPENCMILNNNVGTAPGMWFEKMGTIFISMPGVPPEMKYIMSSHVLPELKKRFTSQIIIHKNIMTYGVPEAKLSEMLSGFEAGLPESIKIAYLPSYGIIKLRLSGRGINREAIEEVLEEQVAQLHNIIPDLIYGEEEESLEMKIGSLLRERNATLCTAESCTGGKVSQMITSVAGSSDYYKGSLVAYNNDIKTGILNVPENYLVQFGAVSRETVTAMAEKARELFSTDFALATSGIAGPGGGSEDKPVGTIWIAAASAVKTTAERYIFGKDRNFNIMRFSNAALDLLRRQIIS